jgi:hypothetical protein
MRNRKQKEPKKFAWKVTSEPNKQPSGRIVFQTQCSSGGGGGGQCHGQCGQCSK